ncbi:unnamed protein product [Heligmosomoides polygyrus]|uniref:Nudix hydrolase domain-containing protein n=1 Tax=Heligmosomoides polygyrus TaxID=6339 RepID=A0A3P8A7I5_HELPZ|nr:unnamed protein product [Heligmosomoides polygyrus]
MNKFGDVVLESQLIPEEVLKGEYFGAELRRLIQVWKRRNVQGIEFIVSPKDSHIIPELIKNGFEFYLVAGNDLVLNRWIGEEPSRFPTRKFWKFPGGMPIEDENLKETATRKVMEKTGVVAEAKTIIGVNHQNRVEYGCVSGLFFVCLMKYVEHDTNAVVSDDIIDIRWFTRDELRAMDNQDFFAPHQHVFTDYEKWIRAGIVSETGDVNVDMFSYFFRR